MKCDKCRKEIIDLTGCDMGNRTGKTYNLCSNCWKKWSNYFNDVKHRLNEFRDYSEEWGKMWYCIFEEWLGIVSKEKVVFT